MNVIDLDAIKSQQLSTGAVELIIDPNYKSFHRHYPTRVLGDNKNATKKHPETLGSTLAVYVLTGEIKLTDINLTLNGMEVAGEQFQIKSHRKKTHAEILTKNSFNNGRKNIFLIRPGDNIYGHWLIDLLPRIELVRRLIGDNVNYVISSDAPNFVEGLLKYFVNASADYIFRVKKNNTYLMENLVIISELRKHDFLSPVIVDFYSKFRSFADNITACNSLASPKFFISRKDGASQYRILKNRIEIETLFRDDGYDVIDPSLQPIDLQVTMFNRSYSLAGEQGSGLHNSLFCREGARIIDLRNRRNANCIQSTLCGLLDQECIYVFGTDTEVFSPTRYSFEIDRSYISKLMSKIS